MAETINPQYPSIFVDTYTPDALIAGYNVAPVTMAVTLAAGQNLTRGALLGVITASGKYVLSLSAAVDGSQVPSAVLAETTNAVADSLCSIYATGEFNTQVMVFGTGHSATTAVTIAGARSFNIHFKQPPAGF
jgi:hypothetical protein